MSASRRVRCASLLTVLLLALALLVGAPPDAPAAAERAAQAVEPGRTYELLGELQASHPGRWVGQRAHREAPAFIARALRNAGTQDVEIVVAPSGVGGYPELRNVFARIPGIDPSHAVVLAAHHDTVGGAPGAIDDGGAVACLFEVARVLAAGPPPACDVEILVFDGEESGLLGSKRWVEDLGAAGRDRIRAAVAVELVGWIEDELVVHTLPYGFAWDAEGIAPAWVAESALAAAEAAGVRMHYGDPLLWLWYQPTVRLLGFGTGSDAGAFSEAGIPACMVAGSSLTGFYTAYHTRRDTMEMVDPGHLDDAARVTAALAITLAERENVPRALGDSYLLIGRHHLRGGWIELLGICMLAPAWIAAWNLARRRDRPAAAAVCGLGFATALLAALGNSIAVVCGLPLVVGVAVASAMSRRRALVLIPATLPALVQVMVVVSATAAFGLRWRGGTVEAIALVVFGISAIASIVLVRLHAPPRTPRSRATQPVSR